MHEIIEQMNRIEATVLALATKMDHLLVALAEDEEDPVPVDLDGLPIGQERDASQPL